ncbi:MAG: restriction endonuclease subunit S, partial [Sphingobacterium thalpophilum]
ELLKEQKAGIINKAVTKGINPNAKMKDCGIEWIGDVPEHWEIWKIKHTSYVKGRIGWDGLRSDEFFENEYAFLVTGTDFIDGKVNWKTCYQITKERYLQDKHIQLKEDDLLITKDGTIGKTAVVKGLVGFASLNSGVFVVRPLRKYISDYLYFILNSNVFTQFINITTTGTTILHLYQNIFEIFEYTVPPIEEQQAIVHYINEESKIIDSLISKYQKQIDLMQEYRTSLISQAVTGKIDVREWEPKKQQTI